MNDGWEVRYDLDPIRDDAEEDPDGDGYTNIEEYLVSNPRDRRSFPGHPNPSALNPGILLLLLPFAGLCCFGLNIQRRRSSLFLLLLVITFTVMSVNNFVDKAVAADELPGLQQVEALPVNPSEADAILASAEKAPKVAVTEGEIVTFSATTSTDNIQAMARALKNDVDLIYEYVHDKVKYTPIFGSLKGADATLTDGLGNDFDQASLMIALLRASGYTANYKYGTIKLSGAAHELAGGG